MVLGISGLIVRPGRDHQQGPLSSVSLAESDVQQGRFAAIETISVGQRVVTGSADDSTSVDPKTWILLRLRAEWVWEDGTVDPIRVATLQPPEWIQNHRAVQGGRVPLPLDLVEMGLPDGLTATVEFMGPCPEIQSGPGRVVLTTVNHLNRDVHELTIADSHGHVERVRPTGNHRFFSLDRGDWATTSSLRAHERLKGLDGDLRVVSVAPLPGVQAVYNMTVEGEHVYHVWSLRAHNMCKPEPGRFDDITPEFREQLSLEIQEEITEWRDILKEQGENHLEIADDAASRIVDLMETFDELWD